VCINGGKAAVRVGDGGREGGGKFIFIANAVRRMRKVYLEEDGRSRNTARTRARERA